MICPFCNKKCKRYDNSYNYTKFVHYKCKYNFVYHVENDLIAFETDKYKLACYLDNKLEMILMSELFDKDNNYINLNLQGIYLNNLIGDNSFNIINDKIEECLIYA